MHVCRADPAVQFVFSYVRRATDIGSDAYQRIYRTDAQLCSTGRKSRRSSAESAEISFSDAVSQTSLTYDSKHVTHIAWPLEHMAAGEFSSRQTTHEIFLRFSFVQRTPPHLSYGIRRGRMPHSRHLASPRRL